MLQIMQSSTAYGLLVAFSAAMILFTAFASRNHLWHTAVGFMAAGRKVPWWLGAISLAITWIWAPALFISTQQAYQNGLAGIFWFTFPNIISLMIIAPLAVRIRNCLPTGFTQPEWIKIRFDSKTHKLYLLPFFWYQLMAVTVQLYAGGSIFALLTGAKIEIVMAILASATLVYSAISGMRASIITDFLQYGLVLFAAALIIPWTVSEAGGWSAVTGGIGGITGAHGSLFDPEVAYNFGIVTSLGLISGSMTDQQHWQRAFSIEKKGLVKAYIVSGLLFGLVPPALSLLGFLGANKALGIELPIGTDPSMIGVVVVQHFLPPWAVVAFVLMLLGALCSVLDSGMCAAGSLFALNCSKLSPTEERIGDKERRGQELSQEEMKTKELLDRKLVKQGRFAMVGITIAGAAVALCVLHAGLQLQYIWWILNTIGVCVAAPTVLSLFWSKTDSKGVFWGILTAFLIGVPMFVYSNLKGLIWLTVGSSLGIVFITLVFCLVFKRKTPFVLEHHAI
jgi:Na+/proline symporter